MAILVSAMLNVATAVPTLVARENASDSFAPIDPQRWVNPGWSRFDVYIVLDINVAR